MYMTAHVRALIWVCTRFKSFSYHFAVIDPLWSLVIWRSTTAIAWQVFMPHRSCLLSTHNISLTHYTHYTYYTHTPITDHRSHTGLFCPISFSALCSFLPHWHLPTAFFISSTVFDDHYANICVYVCACHWSCVSSSLLSAANYPPQSSLRQSLLIVVLSGLSSSTV